MPSAPASPRYKPASIALHWLMLLLIIAVYAAINLRELYPRGTEMRDAMKQWHFMLGLGVLLLVIIRIALRIGQPAPPISPAPSAMQALFAKVVHLALYAFMIGMPIGGWLMLSASGKPIPFFGLSLPALVAPDKALAGFVHDAHELIGTFGYGLIGLHALAALFHHYILKDNVLLRMMPRRG